MGPGEVVFPRMPGASFVVLGSGAFAAGFAVVEAGVPVVVTAAFAVEPEGAAAVSTVAGGVGDKLGGAKTGCSTTFGGCAAGTSSVAASTADGAGFACELSPLLQFVAANKSAQTKTLRDHGRDKPLFLMLLGVPERGPRVIDPARATALASSKRLAYGGAPEPRGRVSSTHTVLEHSLVVQGMF